MEDQQQPNPFLMQENFFEGYQKKIDELRNNPHVIEWDKLCFELFELNEQGKKWIEIVKDRYLINALARPGTATYQIDVIWGEGFKEFARTILTSIKAHQQRILAGNK